MFLIQWVFSSLPLLNNSHPPTTTSSLTLSTTHPPWAVTNSLPPRAAGRHSHACPALHVVTDHPPPAPFILPIQIASDGPIPTCLFLHSHQHSSNLFYLFSHSSIIFIFFSPPSFPLLCYSPRLISFPSSSHCYRTRFPNSWNKKKVNNGE